eukprot:Em0005g731a
MEICPPENNGPVIFTELADVKSRENEALVTEFKDVFSGKPGQTNLTEHSINNMTANPVGQLPYRLPYAHRDLVKQMIDLMLKDGFKVMPFGLKGVPAMFQQMMDKLLQGLEEYAAAYIDDLNIFSSLWEGHLNPIRVILERLRKAHVITKSIKC